MGATVGGVGAGVGGVGTLGSTVEGDGGWGTPPPVVVVPGAAVGAVTVVFVGALVVVVTGALVVVVTGALVVVVVVTAEPLGLQLGLFWVFKYEQAGAGK